MSHRAPHVFLISFLLALFLSIIGFATFGQTEEDMQEPGHYQTYKVPRGWSGGVPPEGMKFGSPFQVTRSTSEQLVRARRNGMLLILCGAASAIYCWIILTRLRDSRRIPVFLLSVGIVFVLEASLCLFGGRLSQVFTSLNFPMLYLCRHFHFPIVFVSYDNFLLPWTYRKRHP